MSQKPALKYCDFYVTIGNFYVSFGAITKRKQKNCSFPSATMPLLKNGISKIPRVNAQSHFSARIKSRNAIGSSQKLAHASFAELQSLSFCRLVNFQQLIIRAFLQLRINLSIVLYLNIQPTLSLSI